MKEIFYDWGGLDVALFHVINNVHSDSLDSFMLLGTALGDHNNFSLYLSFLVLAVFVMLARMPVQDAATLQKLTLRWVAVPSVRWKLLASRKLLNC